ncbi:hypothetical protein BDR26DRAFT_870712 [Obelidium mucronatum]|nr:hypothetical protein BDR26DRAFT_870712 [Obelidium mucronatum]
MSSNPSDTDKCLACEAAKPGASVTAAAAAPSFGGFQASTTGNWTCNSCLVSNPSDKTKCLSCEVPKPGSAAPTLTAAATTAASPAAPPKSTGFSFGAPAASAPTSSGFSFTSASTTASASVNTTASSGFSFKPATTTDESKPKSSRWIQFRNLSAPAAAAAAPSTGASSGFSFGNLGGSSNTGGFSFGSSTTTSTSAAPSSFAAAAATGDEDDDDQTPPDEQIDPSTLMRGAGEESETTNHSVLTKTHVYDATLKKWSDVGKGILKVNVHKETGKARLILRADGSGRVLLNLAVFEGMGVKVEQGKSITFLAMGESGKLNKYLVKVKDAAGAALLCSEIEKVMKK